MNDRRHALTTAELLLRREVTLAQFKTELELAVEALGGFEAEIDTEPRERLSALLDRLAELHDIEDELW